MSEESLLLDESLDELDEVPDELDELDDEDFGDFLGGFRVACCGGGSGGGEAAVRTGLIDSIGSAVGGGATLGIGIGSSDFGGDGETLRGSFSAISSVGSFLFSF